MTRLLSPGSCINQWITNFLGDPGTYYLLSTHTYQPHITRAALRNETISGLIVQLLNPLKEKARVSAGSHVEALSAGLDTEKGPYVL